MAGLKNPFGKVSIPENLPVELQKIVSEMRQERVAFQSLAERAKRSAEHFDQLAEPIAQVQAAMRDIGSQMRSLQDRVPQIEFIQSQIDVLSEAQRQAQTQLGDRAGDVKHLTTEIEDLRQLLDSALALKSQLTGFLQLGGPFKALQSESNDLASQLGGFTEDLARVRQQHDEIISAHQAAAPRLQAFDENYHNMQAGVDDAARRVAQLEQGIAQVAQVAQSVPDMTRQLGTLKALASFVMEKTNALEQQREAIDRATSQATHLGELMRTVDAQIQQQQEYARFLDDLHTDSAELKALHVGLLERSEELKVRQEQIERGERDASGKLTVLREEMHVAMERAVERFELERDGIDSVSERIIDLRRGLAEFEQRFAALEEPDQIITEVAVQAENLSHKVAAVADDVVNLDAEAEKVLAARTEIARIDRIVQDVKRRFDSIQAPAILAALEEAERRSGDVEATFQILERRAQNIDELAERMTAADHELHGRQRAMEETLERLEYASKQRQQATTAAQQLTEQTSKLTQELDKVDERSTHLTELLDDLDERSEKLRFVQKRMAQFEDRMGKWELAERQLNRGLDQIAERQSSVAALRVDLKRLFEMAEQTAEDAREFSAERREIAQHRAALDEALDRLRDVGETADTLEERKRQVEEAEERLSRAEAVLTDIHSSLETVHRHKALLDQVAESATALTFQSKQAEALLATLRQERETIQRIQTALRESQRSDDADARAG